MNPLKMVGAMLKSLSQMVFGKSSTSWIWQPKRNLRYTNQVGDKTGSNVVMAPVLYIAKKETEAPICLENADGEIVHIHPMLDLLRRPNEFYSGNLLRMGLDVSFCLDGNAYAVKIRDGRLKPIALWYIPHLLIEPKWNEGEFISYYKYVPDGREIRLDVDDVIHLRNGIDPHNIRKGFSSLSSAIREIFTDDEAASFSAAILKNAGIPGMIIAPDNELGAEPGDAQDVKDYIRNKFTGDDRGEPLVLSRKTSVVQFGFSPSELDLGKLRNIPEERICALLGIPAAVVGFGTGVQQTKVGATLKHLREMAFEDGIIPIHRLYAEELNLQLLPDFEPRPEKYRVKYDYSEIRVLQEDQEKLVKRLDMMVQGGWLRVDHAQARAGMEVDDSQSIYLRKINQLEILAGIVPQQLQPQNGKMLKSAVNEMAPRIYNMLARDRRRLQDIYQPGLEKRFEEFGERAARLYVEGIEAHGGKNATKNILDDLVGTMVVDELLAEGNKQLLLGYMPHYLRVAHQTIDSLNATIALGVNLTDEIETRVLAKGGKRMGLVDLTGQTKNAMFDAIEKGREAGEGVDAIARRIKNQVSAGPWRDAKTRAEVIARTETKYAQNVSTVEAYKAADNVPGIMVLDSQMGSFDEYCDAVNGRIVTFEEAEWLADEEHPNGTRSFVPVFGVSVNDVSFDYLPVDVPPNNPGV